MYYLFSEIIKHNKQQLKNWSDNVGDNTKNTNKAIFFNNFTLVTQPLTKNHGISCLFVFYFGITQNVFTNPTHPSRMWHKVNFLRGVQQIWI